MLYGLITIKGGEAMMPKKGEFTSQLYQGYPLICLPIFLWSFGTQETSFWRRPPRAGMSP